MTARQPLSDAPGTRVRPCPQKPLARWCTSEPRPSSWIYLPSHYAVPGSYATWMSWGSGSGSGSGSSSSSSKHAHPPGLQPTRIHHHHHHHPFILTAGPAWDGRACVWRMDPGNRPQRFAMRSCVKRECVWVAWCTRAGLAFPSSVFSCFAVLPCPRWKPLHPQPSERLDWFTVVASSHGGVSEKCPAHVARKLVAFA